MSKRIAIAVFVESGWPVAVSQKCDGRGKFEIEFCQFLWNSLIASGAYKECDIVAYGSATTLAKLPNEHVVKVVYEPDRYWQDKSYGYGKSVDCIAMSGDVLADYEFVLRSDTDCFMTKSWRRLLDIPPAVGEVHCGSGAHCNGDVAIRIEAAAKRFGYWHADRPFIHRLGSTFFARSSEAVRACQTTVHCLKKLLEEFGDDEGKWPGWYRGVALLYAGEISLNWHFPGAAYMNRVLFDGHTTSSLEVPPDLVHLHCWHTDNQFSKFWFYNDKYQKPAPSDSRSASNYAMQVAFQGMNS